MSNSIQKILLVEDDTFISQMYLASFTNEGFSVDIAMDGEDGLQKAENGTYDIVILDLMLPKLSGTEVLERLRRTDRGKTLNVIVLTNLNDPDQKTKVMSLNARAYLDKSSLTPGQLVETIKSL